jgi:hypothetical protein
MSEGAPKARTEAKTPSTGAIDLYWIPLGAGGHVVRLNGKIYEAIKAFVGHREPRALYHSALEVWAPDGPFVIEVTPIPDANGRARGVVAEGPVGTMWAGRFRVFRYEIRRWLGGSIPDVNEAVASPVRVATDLSTARTVLDRLPSVPTPTWGRDELDTGDMWNSNSVISWLLVQAGVGVDAIRPPAAGRAPGWDAGLVVARRAGGHEIGGERGHVRDAPQIGSPRCGAGEGRTKRRLRGRKP